MYIPDSPKQSLEIKGRRGEICDKSLGISKETGTTTSKPMTTTTHCRWLFNLSNTLVDLFGKSSRIHHPTCSEANGNGQHVATSKAAFQEIPSAAGLNCTWKSSVLAQDGMGMFAAGL
jgi:hypothetical protein